MQVSPLDRSDAAVALGRGPSSARRSVDRGHDVPLGGLLELESLGGALLSDGLARFLDGGVSWGLVCHGSPRLAGRVIPAGWPLVGW